MDRLRDDRARPRRDALIEVAVLVTDADLNLLDDGLDIVIHAADDVLDTMTDVRRAHARQFGPDRPGARLDGHARRGREPGARLHPGPRPRAARRPLCGNSIATDRAFLARDMPALDEHLHYRMVDVSSIKELARRWYPRVYFTAAGQEGWPTARWPTSTRAFRELAYYRRDRFSFRSPARRTTRRRPWPNAVLAAVQAR